MKRWNWMILAVLGVLAASGCGGQQENGKPESADIAVETGAVRTERADTLPEQPDNAENEKEADETAAQENEGAAVQERPVVLQNLHADGSLFTQTFYQAGNVNRSLMCYVERKEDGDEYLSDQIALLLTAGNVGLRDGSAGALTIHGDAAVTTVPNQNTYQTELLLQGYQDGELVLEDVCSVMVALPSEQESGRICIQPFGDSDMSVEAEAMMGEYYAMPREEDLFNRYLCRAELYAYPTEVLRLERNTIYAAHGRRFRDPALTEYMEKKPWYRGAVEPEDFSEEVLSDAEKKNIALLKEMEQLPSDQREALADYGIEAFAFAPYLSLLSQNQETGLSADLTQAEDCGTFLRVPGSLCLPVTLTRKQWENVRNGGMEELCVNELTGASRILQYSSTQGYLFYEAGGEPDFGPSDIRPRYNYDTGLYELQEASDDTIMKIVYEGDLYILKGAVCGGMVSLTTASEIQQEITQEMQFVYGNCLYHNGRGYFTAIYALGD